MYKLHSGLKLTSPPSVDEYEPESERLASTCYVFGGGDIHSDLDLVQGHDCTAYRDISIEFVGRYVASYGFVCSRIWIDDFF